MKIRKIEEELNKFIEKEHKKKRKYKGHDSLYKPQLINYINKQRRFWITAVDYFIKVGRKQRNNELKYDIEKLNKINKRIR